MADLTVPMDDKGLMDAAFADEPVREEPVAERPQEPPDQPRDEHGRFAPKQDDVQAIQPETVEQPAQVQQPPQTEDDKSGQVPSWRLKELREARDAERERADKAAQEAFQFRQQMQAMQQRLEQLQQPKQDPVDFYADPEAAFKQRLTPLEERQARFEQSMRLNVSRAMAIAMHGAQAVQEMDQALEKATREGHPDLPSLTAQLRASDDPVGVAIQWHKRTKLLEETGGDLTSYRQKALDDALKDPAFLAKALEAARAQAGGQQQPRPAFNLPPSLNKAPGSGVTNAELEQNDMSDAALMAYATAPNRR